MSRAKVAGCRRILRHLSLRKCAGRRTSGGSLKACSSPVLLTTSHLQLGGAEALHIAPHCPRVLQSLDGAILRLQHDATSELSSDVAPKISWATHFRPCLFALPQKFPRFVFPGLMSHSMSTCILQQRLSAVCLCRHPHNSTSIYPTLKMRKGTSGIPKRHTHQQLDLLEYLSSPSAT